MAMRGGARQRALRDNSGDIASPDTQEQEQNASSLVTWEVGHAGHYKLALFGLFGWF